MKFSTIGARLSAGFGAVVVVLCGVGVVGSFVMWRAKSATTAVADAYLPEMNLATSFEREILNARIHFIYHVTIQKPGALEAGWTRFRNARALVSQLKAQADQSELGGLRGPTLQLERDLNQYEPALNDILARVAAGRSHDPDFDGVIKNWASLGNKLVETAGQLNRSSAAVAQSETTS
ncbi:MAG TPA: hypothetical protein VFE22_04220, partial [Edaphobacter sp.]|nr:hypothetical protein [Edaphobacter sp.]